MGIHLRKLLEGREEEGSLVDVDRLFGREPIVNLHSQRDLAKLIVLGAKIVLDTRDGVVVGGCHG